MAAAPIFLADRERGKVRAGFEMDGYLAGRHYAQARFFPDTSGSVRRVAAEPTHRQVLRAARAALVDYSIDRPSLHLCLDDAHTVGAWVGAFDDGCRGRFVEWRGQLAG